MFSLFLAKKYSIDLTVIDIDDYFIAEYRKLIEILNGKASLRLDLQDARRLNYRDNEFDKIFSISVFEHIDNDGDCVAIKECERCLKPGGILVLTVPFVSKYSEKYIGHTIYGNQKLPDNQKIFFSRYYDYLNLNKRIIKQTNLRLIKTECYKQRINFYSFYLSVSSSVLKIFLYPLNLYIAKFGFIKCKMKEVKNQGLACMVFKKDF